MSAPNGADSARRFGDWLDSRFRSAPAIYGLIVFASFIAVSSDHATDAWDMLDTAAWSLVIFFIAHVFAHTLTDHGKKGLWQATRHSIAQAAGMLYAALPSALALVVGGLQDMPADDVYEITVWITLTVLAILGYVAYWRRGAHFVVRLLGAAGTAVLGLFIVFLEYALH